MRTITAFYDTVAEARDAQDLLVREGIERGAISVVDQGQSDMTATTTTTTHEGGGFFGALKDLFLPNEDRYAYEEGIRRGGALLTVRVDEAHDERVVTLLESTATVDIDTRESEWRQSGWAGYDAGAVGVARGTANVAPTAGLAETRTDYAATARGTTGDLDGRDMIDIIEEQIQIGKRDVSRGGVKVRSYIVETPVSESVSLREERVTLERRPVDRALDTVGVDAFRDRTIELTETDEEAVVAKTARVKEELILGKEVEQRVETVTDKVRRTEVEVEDTRTGLGVAATGTTSTTRTAEVDPLKIDPARR